MLHFKPETVHLQHVPNFNYTSLAAATKSHTNHNIAVMFRAPITGSGALLHCSLTHEISVNQMFTILKQKHAMLAMLASFKKQRTLILYRLGVVNASFQDAYPTKLCSHRTKLQAQLCSEGNLLSSALRSQF